MSSRDDTQLAQQRLRAVYTSLKTKTHFWVYGALAFLMYFAFWLRTRNLPLLKDITTGGWALGPDLDPFLFLRWAEHIVANGSLFAQDVMRYVPLGFDTSKELLLLPYMIAWFHHFLAFFGMTESVTHSAVLFPAGMFVLTVGAFFCMTYEIFKVKMGERYALLIALFASTFITIISALLPRTIAGIPEKESIGFLFMFLAFWGFVGAWNATNSKRKIIFCAIAIIGTIAMANAWGGFAYIFVTLSIACTLMFLYNPICNENKLMYACWIILTTIGILFTTNRYSFFGLVISPITGLAYGLLGMMCVEYILKEKIKISLPYSDKISIQLYALFIVLILGFVGAIGILGFEQVINQMINIKNALVSPIVDRFGVTVAENRQPFFTEWVGSFGKLYFFIFMGGAVALVYSLFNTEDSKTRIVKTLAFAYFLLAIIFSRYNPSSLLNGTNTFSLLFYASGFIAVITVFGYYYFKGEKGKLDFGYLFLLSLFFFSVVSARGSVRTIMVLVPAAAMLSWYFCFSLYLKSKTSSRYLTWTAYGLGIILLYLGFLAGGSGILAGNICAGSSSASFFKESYCTAKSFGPSAYTQQWQQAMSWVRENTPENAVFAHWWDYGYWVQSIGKRATILDGGNSYGYWNHLMGRLALTGGSSEALFQYFKTHKATHLLIDSTDIGKYGAFSSIGSGVTYDRRSYIPSLIRQQTLSQTKNATLFLYSGGFSLDQDITYALNGTEVFLPEGSAGIGGIILGFNTNNTLVVQPQAIIVYKNKKLTIPLRYAYQNKELLDFKTGIEAGVFVYPRLTSENGQPQIQAGGAALYLSPKVIHSNIAHLYLFNQEVPEFTLVHEQEDAVIASIRAQNPTLLQGSFLHDEVYGGIRGGAFAGPIKIWEIKYPNHIQSNHSYLETTFPDKRLNTA
ncbi:hypothetical protein FJZ22_00490 [Candidatus Pacearchaeota archaeon]|nr:hypothetical protein [Candidatus Pacearchaeota archaeon]